MILNEKLSMLENEGENSCDSLKSEYSSEEKEDDDHDDNPFVKDIDERNCNKCLYKDWKLMTHKVKISVFDQ